MLSFKLYFENRGESLIPTSSDMTLEEFLDTLVGSSIKDILNKASYMRLYLGNKRDRDRAIRFGFGAPGEGREADSREADSTKFEFVNKLVKFVNKDIFKHRPKERVYETQEFRDKHNYAEYDKLSKERNQLFKDIIRAKSPDEKESIRRAKSVLEDKISNTEYRKAVSQADKEYDRQVELYHNTPLNKQDLSDDGSPEYRDMEQAYNKLIGKVSIDTDEDIIDV